MKKIIAVLPGDGIGPEVTFQSLKVLKAIALKYNHKFEFEEGLIGACAIEATGNPFPIETSKLCKSADAILLGAIGDPKYDNDPNALIRPEQGLLALRKELGLYSNIRPVKCYSSLNLKTPLKNEITKGVDFVVIRELTSGIYFGNKGYDEENEVAFDVCSYSKSEISRITELAFQQALMRKNKLVVVDKANVLETSRLWRKTVKKISLKYPNVKVEFMYVDNASMQLILNPNQFDVILTDNMFGDILTDEASVLSGSMGLMPSASIGLKHAMYEPIHGSYPQAAGKNIANPIGSILSVAMMLNLSFNLKIESDNIKYAVEKLIENGWLTQELNDKDPYSTDEVGDKITSIILKDL